MCPMEWDSEVVEPMVVDDCLSQLVESHLDSSVIEQEVDSSTAERAQHTASWYRLEHTQDLFVRIRQGQRRYLSYLSEYSDSDSSLDSDSCFDQLEFDWRDQNHFASESSESQISPRDMMKETYIGVCYR